MVVDFDDEGFAGFLLLGFLRTRSAGHGCRLAALGGGCFLVQVLAFQPFRAHVVGHAMLGGELVVVEDLLEQACRGRHALHLKFRERAAYARHGGSTVGGGDHELAHHGIELRGDGVALHHTGIHADARSGRPLERGERAGARRQILRRILAGQPELEAVSAQRVVDG